MTLVLDSRGCAFVTFVNWPVASEYLPSTTHGHPTMNGPVAADAQIPPRKCVSSAPAAATARAPTSCGACLGSGKNMTPVVPGALQAGVQVRFRPRASMQRRWLFLRTR